MPYKTITRQYPCGYCSAPFQSNSRDGGKTWKRFCSRECASADFRRPLAERFWEKVDKTGDCWVWMAVRHEGGYGQFSMFVPGKGPRMVQAHRVAYELTYGPIPEGCDCCHHCDNPPCVRPDHLFPGTTAENMQDMTAKGRRKSAGPGNGAKNHNAKLTDDQVREIRKRHADGGIMQTELAAVFGVSKGTIRDVVHRKLWRHVD